MRSGGEFCVIVNMYCVSYMIVIDPQVVDLDMCDAYMSLATNSLQQRYV